MSSSCKASIREFDYLLKKVKQAEFRMKPFKHIVIDDFFRQEHFIAITTSEEIFRPPTVSTADLIEDLERSGYAVQCFPGCTTSKSEYLEWYHSGKWLADNELVEGVGLAFRLMQYRTNILSRLFAYLNEPNFKVALEAKFGLGSEGVLETAIQKYLHGYEISPHPDVRRKALTFMININTTDAAKEAAIHTHLLRFKPEREYIYTYWQENPDVDRCWIPWNWCESRYVTNNNNSAIIFAPSNDTLHAVKLDYNHLLFQRTQIYGNIWYKDEVIAKPGYQELECLSK